MMGGGCSRGSSTFERIHWSNIMWGQEMVGSRARSKGRVVALATAAVCVACMAVFGSSGRATAASVSPGITSTTISLGLLYDATGDDSAGSNPTDGVAARIDAQNAAGGVNGRKI